MPEQVQPTSRLYYPVILTVSVLGIAVMVVAHPTLEPKTAYSALLFLIMTMIAEASPTDLPNGRGTVSVGFAMVYAGIVIFGPAIGIWLAAIGTLSIEQLRGKVKWERVLYNRAQLALSAACGAYAYLLAGGTPGKVALFGDILPLIACSLTYIIANSVFVVLAISVIRNLPIAEAWALQRKMFLSTNYLVLIPLGILIAMVYLAVGSTGVILFILPLLVARFALQRYVDTERFLVGTINALVRAIEARDEYTSGHSERVKTYAVATATEMRLPPDQLKMLEYLASLHDIGKIGIRDGILRKEGPLTAEEYEEVKQHPVMGATILGQLETLGKNVDMLKHHHERFDGKGYPTGLAGTTIPLGARIIAVCDAYDAMTSHRPYRPVKTPQEAIFELQKCAGTQFDPDVVRAFCRIIGQYDLPVKEDVPR
ncbi:MAG: HD-GYP domain-containing protein [Chloroflexota bacterium]